MTLSSISFSRIQMLVNKQNIFQIVLQNITKHENKSIHPLVHVLMKYVSLHFSFCQRDFLSPTHTLGFSLQLRKNCHSSPRASQYLYASYCRYHRDVQPSILLSRCLGLQLLKFSWLFAGRFLFLTLVFVGRSQ